MALFLCPPSVAGFDGGAGSRYQARREVTSFWYPTWLAQPAALVPGSRLLDCAPHGLGLEDCLREARGHEHVIIHTSTPTLRNDAHVAEAIKRQSPKTVIGFVGAQPAVLPEETLRASDAIDWVGGKEFDFTCKEVCEGHPLAGVKGLSWRDASGRIHHNECRELIENMDSLPWVADVYKRNLQIEKYAIGYLLHPYLSLYTGRGCPAQCTFCLWPQTIGGHRYRVRSAENVAGEMAEMKRLFPQVKEFFFDDDTFTANLPRAREIARHLGRLGITWSCNSRANLDADTIRFFRDHGLRLFLVGYESGDAQILKNIKKGISLEQMRKFTQGCHEAGVLVHGTFVLGLPVETRETIERTIQFAQELDVFSIQVSLAAPYPGTELYEQAMANGWMKPAGAGSIVRTDGFQEMPLSYPGLTSAEIYEALDRFYRQYYFRSGPILRIVRSMLEDKDVFVRRCREGWEFFNTLRSRRAEARSAQTA
jgi:hopanoid biosynthesis associated radical SAM protein HpnJ